MAVNVVRSSDRCSRGSRKSNIYIIVVAVVIRVRAMAVVVAVVVAAVFFTRFVFQRPCLRSNVTVYTFCQEFNLPDA